MYKNRIEALASGERPMIAKPISSTTQSVNSVVAALKAVELISEIC